MPYWNGEPCEAFPVWVTIADDERFSRYWPRMLGLVGQRWKAVEVHYNDDIFYLDDNDGEGWFKVTQGRGSPSYHHRNLSAEPGTMVPRDVQREELGQ